MPQPGRAHGGALGAEQRTLAGSPDRIRPVVPRSRIRALSGSAVIARDMPATRRGRDDVQADLAGLGI